jgi:ribosomal protein S8
MNDVISLYVSILNQAIITKKSYIYVPYTRMTYLLSSLLYKENLIYSYSIDFLTNLIQISLNQKNGKFVFSKIARISKPSKRIYFDISTLKSKVIKEGKYYIISTSNGLITSNEALKMNISGEILFEISF